MEHAIPKLIRIIEKELATLDKRTSDRRSTLERELATLDEQAQRERRKLEQNLRLLHQTSQIEEDILSNSHVPMRGGYTKLQREEVFTARCQVMRRLLDSAHGKEVHARDLALALNRPESTVKDYYGEQLELRPSDCFWEFGIDKAHFRWKQDDHAHAGVLAPTRHGTEPLSAERWHPPHAII